MPRTTSSTSRRQARTALDPRLALAREAAPMFEVPRGGWIRTIRSALGMPAGDLAARMGVAATTVKRLEASEAAGRAQLDSLRRAADALNCDLVYALVPRDSLTSIVRTQAAKRAAEELEQVDHTMRLEDQAVPRSLAEDLLQRETEAWQNRLGLWHE